MTNINTNLCIKKTNRFSVLSIKNVNFPSDVSLTRICKYNLFVGERKEKSDHAKEAKLQAKQNKEIIKAQNKQNILRQNTLQWGENSTPIEQLINKPPQRRPSL